jgi:hypothetical protein
MQMNWKTTSLLLFLLICGTRPIAAQGGGQTQNDEAIRNLQNKLDEMRNHMAEMQSELDALIGAKAPPPSTGTTPPQTGSIVSKPFPPPQLQPTEHQQEQAAGEATMQHHTFGEDEADAPRLYNAPLEPTYPGFFQLPGTHTLLRLDGSARTDFTYDPRTTDLTDSFIPSSIPIPSPSDAGNFTASIRGSRIMADFRIPVGERGSARTFIQFDFFGSAGATAPRLRHFYAQFDNILVGQTFTNFMDPDAFADTLDTQGANSAVSVRVPQARYSFGLGGGASAALSIEVPSSSITTSIAGTDVTPTTPAPDGTFKFRNEWKHGHLQLASTFRNLGVRLPDGTHESTFGWGVNATTGIEVHGRDNIVLGLAYGHGIARYVGDLAGLGLDAAPVSPTDLSLRALPVTATYGSYQHYWSPRVRSNGTFGFVQLQNTAFQAATAYHKSTYSSANLIWNPLGSLDLGAEFIYGWVEERSGAHANAPRFQITGRYTFVKLHPTEEKTP